MSILMAFEWYYFQAILNWWHSPFKDMWTLAGKCIQYCTLPIWIDIVNVQKACMCANNLTLGYIEDYQVCTYVNTVLRVSDFVLGALFFRELRLAYLFRECIFLQLIFRLVYEHSSKAMYRYTLPFLDEYHLPPYMPMCSFFHFTILPPYYFGNT